MTALINACYQGREEVVDLLVGADLNLQDYVMH